MESELLSRIRKEYGSFERAVTHYAKMGCSPRLTAQYLGICRTTLTRKMKQFSIKNPFRCRKHMVQECRGGNPQLSRMNQERALTINEMLTEISQYRTIQEFRTYGSFSYATLWRRLGGWKKAQLLIQSKGESRER